MYSAAHLIFAKVKYSTGNTDHGIGTKLYNNLKKKLYNIIYEKNS